MKRLWGYRLICSIGVASLMSLLLSLLVSSVHSEEELNTFRVYTFRSPITEGMIESFRHLAGTGGQVVSDSPYRLLVITTESNHARIAEAVKELDVEPYNVRLVVQISEAGTLAESSASVSGEVEIIKEPHITGTRIRVHPRILDRSTDVHADNVQTLLVASGREGYIGIGEEVPYLDWLTSFGRRHHLIQFETQWQKVGAYLVAEPTVVGKGPWIRIRITPELRGLVEGTPQRIRFRTVATEVVAVDGQTFELGSAAENADFYSRFLVGRDRMGRTTSVKIRMTPQIITSRNEPLQRN